MGRRGEKHGSGQDLFGKAIASVVALVGTAVAVKVLTADEVDAQVGVGGIRVKSKRNQRPELTGSDGRCDAGGGELPIAATLERRPTTAATLERLREDLRQLKRDFEEAHRAHQEQLTTLKLHARRLLSQSNIARMRNEHHGRTSGTIFVRNLPLDVDAQELLNVLRAGACVDPIEVRIPRNRFTGQQRGFAFLAFAEGREAELALEIFGRSRVRQRRCVARWARGNRYEK
jgi:hypothetical protein